MDNQKEFEKLERQNSYEDCIKLALFLIRKINSFPSTAFDEWTDNPNADIEDSEKKKDFLRAVELLRKDKEATVSAVSENQLKSYLVNKLFQKTTSQKLNIIVAIIDELFPELSATPSTTFIPIAEKISHIKTDEDFFKRLPEYIQNEDAILLSKLLLDHERERVQLNEDYILDKKTLLEHQKTQEYFDSEPTNCSLCDNYPCICSDPQHNS